MDIRSYKNIIFDLGGVILNIDPQKTVDAFAHQVYKNHNAEISHLYQKIVEGTLLIEYEKGNIDDHDFRASLCQKLDIELSTEQFDAAFNAMLLNYTKERIDLILSLSKTHNVYLLSNTCHIHYEFYNNLIRKEFGLNGLTDLFKKMFLSFEMGLRKPDVNIYRTLLEEAGIDAADSVFIDDSEPNVRGAQMAGITGIHKPANIDLISIF